jgi:hypothetical protein
MDLYIDDEQPTMSYKQLEVIRGFLCHLSMTYSNVTPYLKGFHLTLAAHHPQQDSQGCKLLPKEWEAYLWEGESKGRFLSGKSPSEAQVKDGTCIHPKR